MIGERFRTTHNLIIVCAQIHNTPHIITPTPRVIDDDAGRPKSLFRDRADDMPLDVWTGGQRERGGVVAIDLRVAGIASSRVRVDHDPQIPNNHR